MTDAVRQRAKRTVDDWLAQPPERRLELVDGEFVEKAAPDFPHANAQLGVGSTLRAAFHRRSGGGGPGGWWIVSEIDIVLGGNGFRPDLAGWRRERVPDMPRERPVQLRPDWICEVISESDPRADTVMKLRRYRDAGVPHYWLVDPRRRTLSVYRHAADGYLAAMVAEAGEIVRAEPFDEIEIRVALLFGDDPDDVA